MELHRKLYYIRSYVVVIGEEVQKVVWSIEQYVIVDAFWWSSSRRPTESFFGANVLKYSTYQLQYNTVWAITYTVAFQLRDFKVMQLLCQIEVTLDH